jgi:hypothetical protein
LDGELPPLLHAARNADRDPNDAIPAAPAALRRTKSRRDNGDGSPDGVDCLSVILPCLVVSCGRRIASMAVCHGVSCD